MTTDTKAVARYRTTLCHGLIEMQEHPVGPLIFFTDHEQVVSDLEAKLVNSGAIAGAAMAQVTRLAIERDALRAELAAKSKDAERWQHARKLLTVDDISQRQVELAAWNFLVSEAECERADKAIDSAMGEQA